MIEGTANTPNTDSKTDDAGQSTSVDPDASTTGKDPMEITTPKVDTDDSTKGVVDDSTPTKDKKTKAPETSSASFAAGITLTTMTFISVAALAMM